jgi:hypothetical protein
VTNTLVDLAQTIAASPVNSFTVWLLMNVPGFPPIIQTVHILGVSAIMGSIVLIDLRVLGLALHGQSPSELVRRLLPWIWWALPFMAVSGLVFVVARPRRYAVNPVFALKFTLLAPALLLAILQRAVMSDEAAWDRSAARRGLSRAMAACSLVLWISVAMAGRWIAYADYIFPPE